VAGALAQVGCPGPLHDHLVEADRGGAQAPDGVAVPGALARQPCGQRQLPILRVQLGQRAPLGGARAGPLELLELVAEPALLAARVERRDRLLPQQRQRAVDQQQRAGDDQDRGQDS
jgi:hypothetical protein